jgi:hypothetical protein
MQSKTDPLLPPEMQSYCMDSAKASNVRPRTATHTFLRARKIVVSIGLASVRSPSGLLVFQARYHELWLGFEGIHLLLLFIAVRLIPKALTDS